MFQVKTAARTALVRRSNAVAGRDSRGPVFEWFFVAQLLGEFVRFVDDFWFRLVELAPFGNLLGRVVPGLPSPCYPVSTIIRNLDGHGATPGTDRPPLPLALTAARAAEAAKCTLKGRRSPCDRRGFDQATDPDQALARFPIRCFHGRFRLLIQNPLTRSPTRRLPRSPARHEKPRQIGVLRRGSRGEEELAQGRPWTGPGWPGSGGEVRSPKKAA